MLLSGVPSPALWAPARAPPTAPSASPSPAALSSVHPPSISDPTGPAPLSAERRCLLGVATACSSSLPSVASSVAPSGGDPSSWTNITPALPQPSPSERDQPAEVYDPQAHDVIVFGGYGPSPLGGGDVALRDTWGFSSGVWTDLIPTAECGSVACPSARSAAALAYDPVLGGVVLFGGAVFSPKQAVFNDTWLLSCSTPTACAWTNITSEVGSAPSPRYFAAMSYDPSDDYVLLFGGFAPNYDTLGDTWSLGTTWSNLTAKEGGASGYTSLKAPEPRGLASIADSPNGYVLLFGGVVSEDSGAKFAIIENSCNNGDYYSFGNQTVAWWFHDGLWSPMNGWGDTELGPCAPPPPPKPANVTSSTSPDTSALSTAPPCGREGAALGWSPKNNQFALYGGYGSTDKKSANFCTASVGYENDTWLYDNVSGGGFLWRNAGDSGDPVERLDMGYASDFTDDYFEIFGGVGAPTYYNSTYRFFEPVRAKLTGPLEYNTGLSIHLIKIPFVVVGYGGSGDLSYVLSARGLKNGNSLDTGGACPEFYALARTLPANGTVRFYCAPGDPNYNVYRLSLTVTDLETPSDHAAASWTYTVLPQEKMAVHSQYSEYFYQNVSFTNTFTIFAEVANAAATSMTVGFGGHAYTPHQVSGSPDNWTVSVNMRSVPKGAIFHAEGSWGSWTDNATLNVTMISFPSWLASVWSGSGANETVHTHGAGPFNETYSIAETFSWDLGSGSGFSLPSIDSLFSSTFDLLPNMTVRFVLTSLGGLYANATVPISTPSFDMGGEGFNLSVIVSLHGVFDVVGSTVQWVNATAGIAIVASFGFSVPIWGFCILGVCIGLTLQVTINASAALQLILAPSSSHDLMGVGLQLANILGEFAIGIRAEAQFSILIASVGLGVGVGVAFAFRTHPNFEISHWWLNGSVLASASFLFWSKTWYVLSGTIAQGDPPPAAGPALVVRPAFDNGTGVPWVVDDRYYNGSGYDARVWDPGATSGPAIDDIYPSTEVGAAAGPNGATLFFTNDNVSEPVHDGLEVSAVRLDRTTNALVPEGSPKDPGYVAFLPHATTLPNGSDLVVWDALPLAETTVSDPTDLTSIALQGAVFDPATDRWGPVRTFSSHAFAGAAEVDATGPTPTVVELLVNTPLLTNTSTERLVEYDAATGAVLANVSVSDVTGILSVRSGPSLAVLTGTHDSYVLVDLATGAAVPIAYSPPPGFTLNASSFAVGSADELALLYTGPGGAQLVLYNASSKLVGATLSLGENVSEAEALASGGTTYVFVRTPDGIEAWSERGGVFTGPAAVDRGPVTTYGIVQDGNAIAVYALSTNGTEDQPTVTLSLAELAAALAPVPGSPKVGAGAPAPNPTGGYLVDLAIAAGAVVALLAVVATLTRRRRSPPVVPPGGASGPAAPPPPADTSGGRP